MTHQQTTDRDRLAEAFRQLRRRGIRARVNFEAGKDAASVPKLEGSTGCPAGSGHKAQEGWTIFGKFWCRVAAAPGAHGGA